jgi:WD40 repeat protein
MSQLFISHSSKDNFAAIALSEWLVSEGWDDLFLDLDPERGIAAGERWERALHQAAHRCDAVLFLVSSNWLSSEWCLREFELAHRLNKRIFGVLIEDLDIEALPSRLTETWQMVNLAVGTGHKVFRAVHPDTGEERHVNFSAAGLKRLRTGLQRAGLDPRFFEWPPSHDPERAPYRGLRPLQSDDAGIFFGRDAPTIELIARLRGLRERGAPRLLAILGASGAGKSSFLRAGLLPRLGREDRHFLPLPVLRPEAAAVTGERGLLHVLVEGLKPLQLARATIRKSLNDPDQLADWLMQRVKRAAPDPDGPFATLPTLVLSIDQAEELFFGEGREESDQLLALIQNLAARDDLPLIVVFTIRSDSYDALQHAKALEGMPQETFSLVPMPKGAYAEVIEGPAKRLKDTDRKLEIEPALTETLLADLDKGGSSDALPLLAFTLERLYREYGDDGDLTQAEYQQLGGIAGSIEAATEEVFKKAQANPKLPNDRKALQALARRALIPWLTGIDPETHSPRRRVARMRDIPEETRPLVDEMIAQRLLTTDRNDDGEVTVEPAHEALLRQWGLLKGWLEEDLGALATLEGIQRATRDWLANDKSEQWLNHTAGRLEEAEATATREDLQGFLANDEHDYLRQCRKAYDARTKKELEDARALAAAQEKAAREQKRAAEEQKRAAEQQRQAVKRTRIGLVAALVLATVAGMLWLRADQQEKLADEEKERAEESLIDANHNFGLALIEKAEANTGPASIHYRLLAQSKLKPAAQMSNAATSLMAAPSASMPVWSSIPVSHHEKTISSVDFSPDGSRLASGGGDNTIKIWDEATGGLLITLQGHSGWVTSVAFSPDGARLASGADDKTIRVWDAQKGELQTRLQGHYAPVTTVAFSPDGARLASGSRDETIKLWDAATGELLTTLEGHSSSVESVAFSPNGARLASGSRDETIKLWDATTGELLVTLQGHVSTVLSVAFSPDGSRLATGAGDDTIKLWDTASGELLITLEGHSDSVFSVAFSQDGSRLASGGGDGTIKLWDSATGNLLANLQGHSAPVRSVAFCPDDSRLASGSHDQTIKLWGGVGQVLTTPERHSEGHSGWVRSVVFSPNGAQVASGSLDKTIKLWDAATGELLTTLEGHSGSVESFIFSPDGSRLASGSDDRTIKLWDPATGELLTSLEGHSDGVTSVAFSPDGVRLASGSWDDTIKLWDAATGEELVTLEDHVSAVLSVAFSPDGARLASGSSDDAIKLWDAATGELLTTLEGHSDWVNSVAFSPDGARLASGSDDETIKLWDAATGELLTTLEGHSDWVNSVVFSPDGARLASGSDDETIKLWDVATGESRTTLEGHSRGVTGVAFSREGARLASSSRDKTIKLWYAGTGEPRTTLEGHSSWINSVAFSPDGARLVSGSADDTIKMWDAATGELLTTLEGHWDRVKSFAFSPDGARLASGSADGTIKLWDVATGEPRTTLEGHSFSVNSVAFSPDGARLASGSDDQTTKLWNPATGELLTTLDGHSDGVTSIAFSPDGARLASGSDDRTIKLWDPVTGELLTTLEGHSYAVNSVAFSQDGARLATGSDDETIKLWDPATGKLLATLEGHSSVVTSVAFSPDGAWLASGSWNETIQLWDAATGELLATLEGHSDRVRSVAFSPDGARLASGSADDTIKLWDLWRSQANQALDRLFEQQKIVTGMQGNGLELVYGLDDIDNLYHGKGASTGRPFWPDTDPFHWIPDAREGDLNAMIHAGNSFLRQKQYDRARFWFEQAQEDGDPRAVERLELLARAVARER